MGTAGNASPYASRQMGRRGFEHKLDEKNVRGPLGKT